MGYVKCSTMVLSILCIAGCASPDPPPKQKTVFDPLTQNLDRARDVQTTVDKQAERTRKDLEAQERGDTPP